MLAACEMSGLVASSFAARGWEAWSADLLPSQTPDTLHKQQGDKQDGYYRHYQGDVRDLFKWTHPVNTQRWKDCKGPLYELPLWDLVVGFPPCTHLALSGARYWKQKQADGRQGQGAEFFTEMASAPAPYVAVENPVGIMGRKKNPLYRVPDQVVQPWMFGDPLVKATCLWLKNLPLLSATHALADYADLQRVATGGGSYRVDKAAGRGPNNTHEDMYGREYRSVMRALTPPGLAQAMASQWGPYIEAAVSG